MSVIDMQAWAQARERSRRKKAAIAEAQEHRAAKVVRYIDSFMRNVLDAHDPKERAALYQRESAWIVSELRRWTPAQWCQLGLAAGLLDYPSDDTKQMVIEQFQWAADNRVEVR